MVLGTKTWGELVAKFTKFRYFTEAKYFRQVVFGNLNSKKFTTIQKNILSDICMAIQNHNSNNGGKIEIAGVASSDEMIFSTSKETIKNDFLEIQKVISQMGERYSSIIRLEAFRLCLIHPEHNGFVKQVFIDLDKDFDLKENSKITFKGKKFYKENLNFNFFLIFFY
jgi:hypothetical protein